MLEQGLDFWCWFDTTQFSYIPLCSPNTCKYVFNPNVTTFQLNCAEGLHFSAFIRSILMSLCILHIHVLVIISDMADLPTVPGFPRKLSFCPGVPETYRMSRDRLPTGFVSRHPFRFQTPVSVYDIHTRNATALGERRRPHAVLRNLQNFQLT